jgi:hypothetical protein
VNHIVVPDRLKEEKEEDQGKPEMEEKEKAFFRFPAQSAQQGQKQDEGKGKGCQPCLLPEEGQLEFAQVPGKGGVEPPLGKFMGEDRAVGEGFKPCMLTITNDLRPDDLKEKRLFEKVQKSQKEDPGKDETQRIPEKSLKISPQKKIKGARKECGQNQRLEKEREEEEESTENDPPSFSGKKEKDSQGQKPQGRGMRGSLESVGGDGGGKEDCFREEGREDPVTPYSPEPNRS